MMYLRRFGLFLLVNITIMVTISALVRFLGLDQFAYSSRTGYGTAYGMDLYKLMGFCLVWGTGGAFISLLLSRWIVKRSMGVEVIDPKRASSQEQKLYQMVTRLVKSAGLSAMPEVGIYDSPDLNAFATGPSASHALVAVSTGLLSRMSDEEVEGVLGHEIAHIANGDMVTMTLLQGIVNAFAMFLSYLISAAVTSYLYRNDDKERSTSRYYVQQLVRFVVEIVLMVLGSIIVCWFSRQREYRADAGGARFAGRNKMLQALQALKFNTRLPEGNATAGVAALQISGKKTNGFLSLFATHPPLEDRIERLSNISRFSA